jgi:hypothetical protein
VPKTPMLRTSERRAFKRCQQKWWWAYREGLKPNYSADALWFGTGIHLALAKWYCGPGQVRGVPPVETWVDFAADSIATAKVQHVEDDTLIERWTDLSALGRVMLEGYAKEYGDDDYIHVIAPEQTFSIDIPWPDDIEFMKGLLDQERLGQPLVSYKGTFDLPFLDLRSDKILIGETKTCKGMSVDHLTLDDQAGSYWAVSERVLKSAKLIKKSDRVAGIEYNFLRKGEPDERPKDEEGYHCNKALKADYIRAFDEMSADQLHAACNSFGATVDRLKKAKLELMQEAAEAAGVIVLGGRSKVQPQPLFMRKIIWRTKSERRKQLLRIQDEALHMEMVRQGILLAIKNPTFNCKWDCEFHGLCELDEQGADTEDFRRLQFRVEDPYADHRKSTED